MPRRPGFLAVLVALAAFSSPAGALDCDSAPEIDRITAIPARGELRLASERTLRLAGVRLADAGAVGADARAALAALVDAPVAVRIHAGTRDRWGRLPGAVALAGENAGGEDSRGENSRGEDSRGGDLARYLVAQGLALVDAGDLGALCDPGLLEIEAGARRAGRGVWADPRAHPLAADDQEGLAAAIDRFALVEGRVRRVGVRARQAYLDFAPPDAQGFTVVVPAGIFAALEASGLDARALRGRRIRARGIIQSWRGTAVTITALEMIEILEARPGVR